MVDILSKTEYFMSFTYPYSVGEVAQVFMDTFFKLHGFPKSITSDEDTIFTSKFW